MDHMADETGGSWNRSDQASWLALQAKVNEVFAILRSARSVYRNGSRPQGDAILRMAWRRCREAEQEYERVDAPEPLKRKLRDDLAYLRRELFAIEDSR